MSAGGPEFSNRIPRYLDAQPKIFLWDADEFVVTMAPLGVGIVTGFIFTSIVLGLLAGYGLSKLKRGRGSGFMLRAAYWYLPNGGVAKMKRTPPSHLREFVG